MKKFKMPPHPAFTNDFGQVVSDFIGKSWDEKSYFADKVVQDMLSKVKTDEDFIQNFAFVYNDTDRSKIPFPLTTAYKRMLISKMKLSVYTEIMIRASLYDCGCNLFKIEGEHWDESNSRKSIEKMQVKDFMLPFDTCAIDMSGVKWAGRYTLAMISHYEGENGRIGRIGGQLLFRFENKKLEWVNSFIPNGGTFKEGIASLNISEEVTEMVYRTLSVLMYAATFKRDPSRVKERNIKARNIPGFPKYRINEVRLIQPEYSNSPSGKSRKSSPHAQYYAVKGHWRTQPFGKKEEGKTKTIWISMFWKGKGREQVMKIYRV